MLYAGFISHTERFDRSIKLDHFGGEDIPISARGSRVTVHTHTEKITKQLQHIHAAVLRVTIS